MSFTVTFFVILAKAAVLWLIINYIHQQNQRDSADWQHKSLATFLVLSPLLLLTPWMAFLPIPVTVNTPASDSTYWLDQYQLPVLLTYCFISTTLISYRLLCFLELARAEKHFKPAPYTIVKLTQQFLDCKNSCRCLIAPSDRVFAYVWRPTLIGKHRLIVSDRLIALAPAQQEIIIAHECAHIKRNDWLHQQGAYLVCCLFWWFPGFWRVSDKLSQLAEHAADDRAIEALGGRENNLLPAHYAELLIAVKNNTIASAMPVTNMVSGQHFYTRIDYLLEQLASHSPLATEERRGIWGITLLWLLPLIFIGVKIDPITPVIEPDINFEPANQQHQENNQRSIFDLPKSSLSKPDIIEPLPIPASANTNQLKLTQTSTATEVATYTGKLETKPKPSPPAIKWQELNVATSISTTYPKRILRRGFSSSGEVTAVFSIDANGSAFDIKITNSNPKGWFDKEVKKAISKSKFTPLTINGERATITDVTEIFVFTLEQQ